MRKAKRVIPKEKREKQLQENDRWNYYAKEKEAATNAKEWHRI